MMRQRSLGWVALSLIVAIVGSAMFLGCGSATNGSQQSSRNGGTGRDSSGMPTGPSVYEIIAKLDLEPDQFPQVRAVLEQAEVDRKAVMEDMRSQMQDGADRSLKTSMRDQLHDVSQRIESELSELLTDDQMETYLELMEKAERKLEEVRPQADERPPGGRGSKGSRF